MEIISLGNDVVRRGEDISAVVRLKNIGKEPVKVPWSLIPDEIEHPDKSGRFDFVMAAFTASLVGSKGYVYFQSPVHLYGSESASGTLLQIYPGEWIDLKIKVFFDCASTDSACKNLESGPARILFTWTDYSRSDTYEECSVSTRSERGRVVISEPREIELLVTQ